MLKRRDRVINFRVTEDEFTRLRDASLGNGARCLSDFARTAILNAMEGCNGEEDDGKPCKDQIHSLAGRLELVERSIIRLESMLARFSAEECQEMKTRTVV